MFPHASKRTKTRTSGHRVARACCSMGWSQHAPGHSSAAKPGKQGRRQHGAHARLLPKKQAQALPWLPSGCVSMDPSNSNESITAKLDAKNLKLHFKGVIIISSILMLLPGFCTHPSQAFISIFFWQGKPHLSPSQHQPRLRAKCIQTSVLFAMLVAWGGKCFGNTWEEELVAQARLGEHAGLLLPVSLLHQVSFS